MPVMLRKAFQNRYLGSSFLYSRWRDGSTNTGTASYDALPFSKIPRIPSIPLIGSAWIYLPIVGKYKITKLHTANVKKYHEYGPIFLEDISRDLRFVYLYDPEDVAKVFRNEGRYPERIIFQSIKKYRDNKKDLYNNGGLLTTSGKEWWQVRSASQPHMMKPKAIQAHLDAMDQVAHAFIDRMIRLRDKDGEVPNYLKELNKWALESIALVAFDARLGCLDPQPNQDAMNMMNASNTILELLLVLEFSIFKFWRYFPTLKYRKFVKSMDYCSTKALKFLEEAKKRLQETSEDHEPTFLELMISTSKDPRDLTAMMTDMLLGGIDTTSCTLGYALYHLARNQEVQEKVYQEIKSNVGSGPLTVQSLNNLPYLKACVKESMRLNPVVLGHSRSLAEDTVLGGYTVPAGTKVFTQAYAIGQLDKYFPKPQKFLPDRFLRSESKHHPYAFIPFGFGPRSCIGQRIAQQEIWTLLTRIIEKFRVEYNHEALDMNVLAVAVPDKPLRFQFYDR